MKKLLAVVVGLGLLSSSMLASPSMKDRLVGTWRLVSIENRDSTDQPWENRFGENPRGYLMYDESGHMALQFGRTPPTPTFASGNDWKPTPEEVLAAYLGYLAYWGTFSVDEASGLVTHHIEGSLRPSFTGKSQPRPGKLEGNRLVYSDGKTFRVIWERVP